MKKRYSMFRFLSLFDHDSRLNMGYNPHSRGREAAQFNMIVYGMKPSR
jgi:hypothetical protein